MNNLNMQEYHNLHTIISGRICLEAYASAYSTLLQSIEYVQEEDEFFLDGICFFLETDIVEVGGDQ